jgi:hypothetical protein
VAVAYVSSSRSGASDTQTASCIVPVPVGAAVDIIALYAVELWESFGAAITRPTGFDATPILDQEIGPERLIAWWKRLTAADSGNYTATWTGNIWNQGNCIFISGGITSGNPVEDFAFATATSGTAVPVTSVDTLTEAFLAHFVANDNGGTGTPPSIGGVAMTEVQEGDYIRTNYRIPAASGTFTTSGGTTPDGNKIAVLIAIKPAGGGSVSGSAAAAFGGLAATAAGTRTTPGTVAAGLGALAATATGTRTTAGTAAAALGALSASAAGAPVRSGTAAAPLGGLAASAAGVVARPGTASAPLGGLTATATAVVTVTGTAVAVFGALTATVSGTRTTTGTATAVLGGLSAAAAGGRTVHSVAAAALGGLAAAASGTGTAPGGGLAAATLGPLTATAVGVRTVQAGAAAPLGGLTATAVGVVTVPGAGTAALGALVASAVGARMVHGVATATLGALTAAATGTSTPAGVVSGAAAAALGALTAHATGTVTSPGPVVGPPVDIGSWWSLAAVVREAHQPGRPAPSRSGDPFERLAAQHRNPRSRRVDLIAAPAERPVACPDCGEPLETVRGVLHCRFDGWTLRA